MIEPAKEFIKRTKANRAGKIIFVKDIGRKGKHFWQVESVTLLKQHDNPEKIYSFERLKYVRKEGTITHRQRNKNYQQYRLGYYIVGKKGNKKGKWTWGQYNPHITIPDFYRLINKAQKERTLLRK